MKLNYSLNIIVNCVELVKSRRIIVTLSLRVCSWNINFLVKYILAREKRRQTFFTKDSSTHEITSVSKKMLKYWSGFFVFFFRNENLGICLIMFDNFSCIVFNFTDFETFDFRIRSDQSGGEDLLNSKLKFLLKKKTNFLVEGFTPQLIWNIKEDNFPV